MSFGWYCILIATAALATWAAWRMYWVRAEKALKASPPKPVCFEVMVSRGVDDSLEVSDKLYRKVVASLRPHLRDFLAGTRKMSVVLAVSRPHQATEVHCYVYCDPNQEGDLKRRLRSDFRHSVFLSKAEDPMAIYAEAVRPIKLEAAVSPRPTDAPVRP